MTFVAPGPTWIRALAFGAALTLAIGGSGSPEENHPTIAFGLGLQKCSWWQATQDNSNKGSMWLEGYCS